MLIGLSETLGVAEAIGALLIGLVLGETEQSGRLERVVIYLNRINQITRSFNYLWRATCG